jgi:hypothetical protein
MMTFTTIIPRQRNDGSAVSRKELNAILRQLRERFGGVTIDGEVEGHWVDPSDGKHYRERSLKITVACDRERLHEAEDVVREIGRQLGQKAMYFEVRYYDGVRILRIDEP